MIVIFNPTAGQRRASLLWRVLDVLSENGVRFEVAATRHQGHATELARQAAEHGTALVVAAGGDGTVAEVVSGLIGSGARLGVVPLGTANVLARSSFCPPPRAPPPQRWPSGAPGRSGPASPAGRAASNSCSGC